MKFPKRVHSDVKPVHVAVAEAYNKTGKSRKRVRPEDVRAIVVSVVQYKLPVEGLARALRLTEETVEGVVETYLKHTEERVNG